MFQARVEKETAIAEELFQKVYLNNLYVKGTVYAYFQKVHFNNLYFKGTRCVVSSIFKGLYAQFQVYLRDCTRSFKYINGTVRVVSSILKGLCAQFQVY